ncbi:acyl carrier protein [Yinghuangia soli]|uniref:Acyl carrier protein n=1 Tax=Yinghuangia soli TaxID=2908204 RepID=A0AA41Q3W1_9ACTN|nr:acyl carrier protein [Yinghuangia soli]MCF2531068.1 acyl carrier protein [Yinghuangia soli]
MNGPFGFDDLAALMKSAAGITADPVEMESRPDAEFADFGLDSLGLMAVVGEVEHDHNTPLGPDAERCKTPHEFVSLVNSQITSGV